MLQPEKESFNALRRVTMELKRLQHQPGHMVTEKYQELQLLHHSLMVKAYPPSFVRPKHHVRFHQADQMKRIGAHYDTFAGERKHKTFKSHIGLHRFDPWAQDEGGKFGELCFRAVWQHHVAALSAFNFETALLGTPVLSPKVSHALGQRDCETSEKITYQGKIFKEKDMFLGKHPGILVSAVKTPFGGFYLLLQPFEVVQQMEFWSYWKVGAKRKLVPVEEIGQRPSWWLKLDEERMLCLH